VRVLGSGHSFTEIADSDQLVTLERLAPELVVDRGAMSVTIGGAVRYGELAGWLAREGLALANLASLPHISVAGAVATGSHGSGDRNGNLATAVAGLELVTSDGELLRSERGAPDFDGLVVGLGATGAVTRITLDVEPAYEVSQQVFGRLEWETLFDHFDAITSAGYSVSVFTLWSETTHQVWVKRRVGEDLPALEHLFGAPAATTPRHPIPGLDPRNCTAQLGVAGLWSDRLQHFRMDFTPSSGAELQSEYLVPRRHGVDALRSLLPLSSQLHPLIQTSEIRTVAADTLWMSPQYRRDTVAIHFTWKPESEPVRRALANVERALAPFEPRPHWGKLFLAGAEQLRSRYERLDDFAELLARVDPRGAFRNRWLEERVLG
jgi:xylitol oxidase